MVNLEIAGATGVRVAFRQTASYGVAVVIVTPSGGARLVAELTNDEWLTFRRQAAEQSATIDKLAEQQIALDTI